MLLCGMGWGEGGRGERGGNWMVDDRSGFVDNFICYNRSLVLNVSSVHIHVYFPENKER